LHGRGVVFRPLLTELANRGARFAHFPGLCNVAPPCSVEGVFLGVPGRWSRVWRPGSWPTQPGPRVVSDHRPRRRETGLP
jgi:hypothetical protein